MRAENWLPWRKSSHAPHPEDTGMPACRCRWLWATLAPHPPRLSPSSVSHHPAAFHHHHHHSSPPKRLPDAKGWSQLHPHRMFRPDEKTPLFPPDQAEIILSRYLSTAEATWRCADGDSFGRAAQTLHTDSPNSRGLGGWKRQRQEIPCVQQHLPSKDEADKRPNALPDSDGCLAPDSTLC